MLSLELAGEPPALLLIAGQFCLIPASLERTEVLAKSDAALLRVEAKLIFVAAEVTRLKFSKQFYPEPPYVGCYW